MSTVRYFAVPTGTTAMRPARAAIVCGKSVRWAQFVGEHFVGETMADAISFAKARCRELNARVSA